MELGILSKLNFMRKNSVLCDLKVKTNDNVVIEMHRVVWLAAFVDTASLKSQFTTKMDKISNLYLPHVSGNMLKTIVDFIYGEKMKDIPTGLQETLEKLGFSDWRSFLPEPDIKTEAMVIKQEPNDFHYSDIPAHDSTYKGKEYVGNEKHSDKISQKDKNQNEYAKCVMSKDSSVDISVVKTESCDYENQDKETNAHGENRKKKKSTVDVPSFRISFVESNGDGKDLNKIETDSLSKSNVQSCSEISNTGTDLSKPENDSKSQENAQESPKKQPTILPKFSNDETQVKTLATFSPVFEYVRDSNGQWICNTKKLLPVPLSRLDVDLPSIGSDDHTTSPEKVLTTAGNGGIYMYETNAVKAIATDKNGSEVQRYMVPPDVVNALKDKMKSASVAPKKRGRKPKKIVHVHDILKGKTMQGKHLTTSYGPIAISPKTDSKSYAISNSSTNVPVATNSVPFANFGTLTGQNGQNGAPYLVTSHQPRTVQGQTLTLNLGQSNSVQNAVIRLNNPSQNVPIALQNTNINISNTGTISGIQPVSFSPAVQQIIQPCPVSIGSSFQTLTFPQALNTGSSIQPLTCPPPLNIGSTFQPLTTNSNVVGSSVQQNQFSGSTCLIQTPDQNLIELHTPRIISLGPEDFDKSAVKGNTAQITLKRHSTNRGGKTLKNVKIPEEPVKLREIKPKPSEDTSVCTQEPTQEPVNKTVGCEKPQLDNSEEKDNKYVIYDAVNDFENINQKHVLPTSDERAAKKRTRSGDQMKDKPHTGRKSRDHEKLTLLEEPIEKYMSKFAKKNSTRKDMRKIKMEGSQHSQRKRRYDVFQSKKKPEKGLSGAQVHSEDNEESIDVKVEVSDDSSFVTVFLDTGGSDEEDRVKNGQE